MSFFIDLLLLIIVYSAAHLVAIAGLAFLLRLASAVVLARMAYGAVRAFCGVIERLVPGGSRANALWFKHDPQAIPIADLGGGKDFAGVVGNLKTGERWVKERHRVFFEKVPELPNPWKYQDIANRHTEAALRLIRQRPEYRTPPRYWYDSAVAGDSRSAASATKRSQRPATEMTPSTSANN